MHFKECIKENLFSFTIKPAYATYLAIRFIRKVLRAPLDELQFIDGLGQH